jgi:hypothetical protein
MMDNTDRTIREALGRELAPLFADCEQIGAEIDLAESTLLEISDRHERAAARVELTLRRAKLNSVVSRIQDTEEHFMRLADERFPQWRT